MEEGLSFRYPLYIPIGRHTRLFSPGRIAGVCIAEQAWVACLSFQPGETKTSATYQRIKHFPSVFRTVGVGQCLAIWRNWSRAAREIGPNTTPAKESSSCGWGTFHATHIDLDCRTFNELNYRSAVSEHLRNWRRGHIDSDYRRGRFVRPDLQNFDEAYINQHTCLVRPMNIWKPLSPQLFCSPFAQLSLTSPNGASRISF